MVPCSSPKPSRLSIGWVDKLRIRSLAMISQRHDFVKHFNILSKNHFDLQYGIELLSTMKATFNLAGRFTGQKEPSARIPCIYVRYRTVVEVIESVEWWGHCDSVEIASPLSLTPSIEVLRHWTRLLVVLFGRISCSARCDRYRLTWQICNDYYFAGRSSARWTISTWRHRCCSGCRRQSRT